MSRSTIGIGTAVLAAVVALALAGCGTSSPGASATGTAASKHTSRATAKPSPKPTVTLTPKAGANGAAPTQGSGLAPTCTLDQLDIVYSPTDNTAGHAHGVLTFGNTGASACSLTGYATVTFDNPEAEQPMGAPAGHDPSHPAAEAVASEDGFSTADLTITDAGIVRGCTVVTATALIVTAPGLTSPRNVPIPPTPACEESSIGLLQVSANYIPPGS